MLVFIRKTNSTFDAGDFTALPQSSQDYIISYGMTQAYNDAHASVIKKDFKGTDAEFAAAVTAKVTGFHERVKSGAVRAAVAEDPKKVMLREVAKLLGREVTEDEILALDKPTKRPVKVA
jgi:hypothetical protein